jgi:flagellar M-ring protein FliF
LSFLQGIFSRIKGWFAEIWEKTEKRDRTRFLVISGVALTLIIAAMVMLSNSRYTELVASATPAQMRAATAALSDGGVRYRTSGGTLFVHRGDYGNGAAILAQTTDAGIDFDLNIYAHATGITGTEADRRAYSVFQAQDDLKRTLEAMPMIDTAAVIIKAPARRSGFFDEVEPVTVSVILLLNSEMDRARVDTIESLVSRASGADPENIAISDQFANLLNRRFDDVYSALDGNYAHKQRVEQDLAAGIRRLMDPLFGARNYTVGVFADIDFDDYSSERVTFTPVVDDEGIPRSTMTIHEFARGANLPGGFPGTDENGIGMDADEYVEIIDQMASEYSKRQENINYEINQLNEFLSVTPGKFNGLTVSVNINSDGLDEQNPADVQALVGASVGLTGQATGNVVVRYLPMFGVREEDAIAERLRADQQREAFMELIRILVLYLIIGLCLVMLIIKTFNLLKPKPLEPMEGLFAGEAEDYADMLEAAQSSLELEVTKTPTRERVEEFIDSHPEAVASMLRNWLQDEEGRGW